MGILSAWRHHLQNEANRETIAAARRKRADEQAEADAQRRHDIRVGGIIRASQERKARMTPADCIDEYDNFRVQAEIRGDSEAAENFRLAAEVVQRMSPAEFASFTQARLAYDHRSGAKGLAHYARTGQPTPWAETAG